MIPDTRSGFYYVSCIDGNRSARLLGPFTDHATALARVDNARMLLLELIPKAWFYAFGTCRCDTDLGPGYLDSMLADLERETA